MKPKAGKLFFIPSPIGNLEDITFRAVRILQEIDFVFCENIQTTSKLLRRYEIKKKMFAHHQNNEKNSVFGIIKLLNDGKQIAYLSEAGTPGISDPGYLLAKNCIDRQIHIECLPGPTALIPALINSGLSYDEFTFVGFLPRKKGRKKKLENLSAETRVVILYESTHRIMKLFDELMNLFDENRLISVSRELTKIHEETIRGTIKEVAEKFKDSSTKGEFVICIEGQK